MKKLLTFCTLLCVVAAHAQMLKSEIPAKRFQVGLFGGGAITLDGNYNGELYGQTPAIRPFAVGAIFNYHLAKTTSLSFQPNIYTRSIVDYGTFGEIDPRLYTIPEFFYTVVRTTTRINLPVMVDIHNDNRLKVHARFGVFYSIMVGRRASYTDAAGEKHSYAELKNYRQGNNLSQAGVIGGLGISYTIKRWEFGLNSTVYWDVFTNPDDVSGSYVPVTLSTTYSF